MADAGWWRLMHYAVVVFTTLDLELCSEERSGSQAWKDGLRWWDSRDLGVGAFEVRNKCVGQPRTVKQQHSAAAQLLLQHQQRAKHVLHTLFFVSNRVRNRWVNSVGGKDRSEHMFWCLPPVWDAINVPIPLFFFCRGSKSYSDLATVFGRSLEYLCLFRSTTDSKTILGDGWAWRLPLLKRLYIVWTKILTCLMEKNVLDKHHLMKTATLRSSEGPGLSCLCYFLLMGFHDFPYGSMASSNVEWHKEPLYTISKNCKKNMAIDDEQ